MANPEVTFEVNSSQASFVNRNPLWLPTSLAVAGNSLLLLQMLMWRLLAEMARLAMVASVCRSAYCCIVFRELIQSDNVNADQLPLAQILV